MRISSRHKAERGAEPERAPCGHAKRKGWYVEFRVDRTKTACYRVGCGIDPVLNPTQHPFHGAKSGSTDMGAILFVPHGGEENRIPKYG